MRQYKNAQGIPDDELDTDNFLNFGAGHEAILQEQIRRDKARAVKNIAAKIKEHRAKGSDVTELEEELFTLCRDEFLDYCKKDNGGLLDEKKLAKIPGSQVYFRERYGNGKSTRNSGSDKRANKKH